MCDISDFETITTKLKWFVLSNYYNVIFEYRCFYIIKVTTSTLT